MKTPTRFLQAATRIGLILAGGLSGLASAQVAIDQAPLVVARPLPPNIMFIMDDSGSMGWQHMPGTNQTWTHSDARGLPYPSMNNDIRLRASNINSQWYDPQKTYTPWKNWDGSSRGDISPANAPYDASGQVTSGNLNLRRESYPSAPSDSNRDNTSVTSGNGREFRFQGFYMYQGNIQTDDLAEITDDDNYKRFDFRWNNSNSRWEGRYCKWDVWGTGTSLNDCSYYSNPATIGPFGRTMAQEVQNYANWFSYYRLRANMAKAAASQVFADLSEDFRVGYNTIWNRQDYRIPVATNEGRFSGANKQNWFTNLFATGAGSNTPLRQALDRAGQYFSETGADGPWGPEQPGSQFSCRQNFSILTTDGYWNSNQADTSAARADTDGTAGAEITGPNGMSFQYEPTRPYTDNANNTAKRGNTLADVAMYYWKNDIREDLKNDVPTSNANPAFWQHMVTFGISIGEKGELVPTEDLPALTAGTKAWPAPGNDRAANIDDLWHAAVNSRGEFIVASDADAFTAALTSALGTIADRLGSGASLAANATSLDDPNTSTTYQAQYWSGTWRGDLAAYPIQPNGTLAANPSWRAATALPAWNTRNIHFNDGNTSPAAAHKPFTWDNLTSAQRTALGSQQIVDYLRGDATNEESQGGTGTLRARTTRLGDIINSQPVYVGAPDPQLHNSNASFDGASSYASFASTYASRTPVIYVGGNDGMLHGFNANTGVETYAFIPNAVINSDLATLALPDYEHRYFVDGEITIADVYTASTGWRSILIGTLGRSTHKAVYALDVTNPGSVQFLWEKSASDIAGLGQVLGKPMIVKVGNNNWKVLIGNGMNSPSGTAQLLMIDIFPDNTGTVHHTSVTTNDITNNGLSAIVPWDSNGDGYTDMAYGGDRFGNLWRFSNLGTTPSAAKLFEATGPSGLTQPITAAPMVGINLRTKERWVFFGTGQYLNAADISNDEVQSWYGLIDSGTLITARSQLAARSIFAEGEVNGFAARSISASSSGDMFLKRGWYIDLVSPENGAEGERMVTPNQYRGGALIGTTRIPDGSDPCNPGGRGFVMAINPFTGARLPQTFFDLTLDGSFDSSDMLVLPNGQRIPVSGVGFGAGPNNPIFIGNTMHVSLDDGSRRSFNTPPWLDSSPVQRRSWRELIRE